MDLFNSWIVNKYVAHRGLHDATHPENSLAAFQRAIENEFVIELDVHPLLDGTPVVFHDDTLIRMTGQDGYIKKVKNVEELKKLTLKNSDQKIPTLAEALAFVDGKTPVIVEIKDSNVNSNFEAACWEILKNYHGEYAVMSFNPYSMKWFRLNAPQVIRGQLASSLKGEKLSFFKKWALKRMALNKTVSMPDFIAYKWDEVPNRYVKKYKKVPLLVWAVPSQADYIKVAPHCDNIIFENFIPRI